MSETIFQAAALILPLIFAIVFHEVAHGWVARALGDPTAHEANRLSLNPLRHVDPMGTIILPGFLALVKGPVIGWAKPVPVNKYRLRNPRFGMMAVAAAGPATNFVLAAIGAVLLGLLAAKHGGVPQDQSLAAFVATALIYFLQVNVFLALFNLLPIPPFDGSHLVEGLLPRAAAKRYARLRPYGLGLMIALLIVLPWAVPGLSIIQRFVLPPVNWMLGNYFALADAVAGGI
ncbi:site-2 protease family protein [Novosphingobium sp. G106]|uniref:site-2 protease family protein n=1 Tax=Novosphingobium sp. G106 TaxID=2849500 RepID=UPI001C2DDDE3|nr:site-2 protease family protein [Novosphingobium sp. G106]MBV1689045.1 site-2 protease family protein [Novosphingobium sp. G106]